MYSLGEIKTGYSIMHNGAPHVVLSAQHAQMGRGGANLKTKLRNLVSGAVIDYTFSGNVRVDVAPVTYQHATFLYKDGEGFHFMDSKTFEQFLLSVDQVGNAVKYLAEGTELDLLVWEGKALAVKLPATMVLGVTEAEPGVKGDSASGGGTKPVTIETGTTVLAPLFVKQGDKIRINTENGQYLERV